MDNCFFFTSPSMEYIIENFGFLVAIPSIVLDISFMGLQRFLTVYFELARRAQIYMLGMSLIHSLTDSLTDSLTTAEKWESWC